MGYRGKTCPAPTDRYVLGRLAQLVRALARQARGHKFESCIAHLLQPSPNAWASAAGPTLVTVRAGAGVGGSDRVEMFWADNVIKNTWLEVTVRGNDTLGESNTNTGLVASHVFFFGSAVGDSGADNAAAFSATSADEISARNDPHGFLNPATISNVNDFNRDGQVNSADQIIARNNSTGLGNQLTFLSIGADGPSAPASTVASAAGDRRSNAGADLAWNQLVGPTAPDVSVLAGERNGSDAFAVAAILSASSVKSATETIANLNSTRLGHGPGLLVSPYSNAFASTTDATIPQITATDSLDDRKQLTTADKSTDQSDLDEELLDLLVAGQTKQPRAVRAQADRMACGAQIVQRWEKFTGQKAKRVVEEVAT